MVVDGLLVLLPLLIIGGFHHDKEETCLVISFIRQKKESRTRQL